MNFYANHKPTLKNTDTYMVHGVFLVGMLREQLEKKGLVPHIADSMLLYADAGLRPEDILEDALEDVIDRDVIIKLGDKEVHAKGAFYRFKGLNKGIVYHVQDTESRNFAQRMIEDKPSSMKVGPFCIGYSEYSRAKWSAKKQPTP